MPQDAVTITIAFTESIDQDRRILVAIIDDAGHGDDVTFDPELILQFLRIILECKQHLLEFINRLRHLKAEEVHPLGIDEAHVADRLDRCLLLTELLDPGESPDMSFLILAHRLVFRIFGEHLIQVRHIFLNILFHIQDQALISVFQKIRIAHARTKDEIRKFLIISKCQCFLIAPLVCLNRCPLHMNIRFLLKALEDRAIVRIRLRTCRIGRDTSDRRSFLQREGVLACHHTAIRIRKNFHFPSEYIGRRNNADRKHHCQKALYRLDTHESILLKKYELILDQNNNVSCAHPLMEPAIMPASKYFWKNGYMTSSGRLEMMIVAYFRSSAS